MSNTKNNATEIAKNPRATICDIFSLTFHSMVMKKVRGDRTGKTYLERIIERLLLKAVDGDIKSIREVIKLMTPATTEPTQKDVILFMLTATEEEIRQKLNLTEAEMLEVQNKFAGYRKDMTGVVDIESEEVS